MLAYGMLARKQSGFSAQMPFADPAASRSPKLAGSHLMVGRADVPGFGQDVSFTSVALLGNASGEAIEVSAKVSFRVNEEARTVELGTRQMLPQQVEMLDLREELKRAGMDEEITGAGLMIETTGQPGSLVAHLLSFDETGDFTFYAPMKDPALRMNSFGGSYPFDISDDFQSIIHVRNTADEKSLFTIQLDYEGGSYALPIQELAPQQEAAIDVRRLREAKIPDSIGRVMPEEVTSGQVTWTQRGPQALIGRVESYSLKRRQVTTSFSCPPPCCPPSTSLVFCELDPLTGGLGGTALVQLFELQQRDCDGAQFGPFNVTTQAGWSSENSGVATIGSVSASGAVVNCVGLGGTNIKAEYFETQWTFNPVEDGCEAFLFLVLVSCPVEVQPCGVMIVEETISPGDGTLPVRNPAKITRQFAPVFEATLNPSGCPVTWSIVSGGGAIQGSTTSPLVTVRGDSVSTVVLRATTSGGVFREISVPVENQRVVEVRVWIVRRNDGTGAWVSTTTVNNHLTQANQIWEQCAIKFNLVDGIQFINNTDFRTPNLDQRIQLRDTHMGTSGIEIYYTRGFPDVPDATGATTDFGVIVNNAGNGRTLAHELGHAMGLGDGGTANLHLMNGAPSTLKADIRLTECNSLTRFTSN